MIAQSDLDRLLVTLDVDVQTLAFCELGRGRRLAAPPINAIMMHYVLEGTMHMTLPDLEPIICPPGSIALIPPNSPLHVAADDGPATDFPATEHCSVTREGVLLCDITDGGARDLRYVSGIVLASLSGSFGIFDEMKIPIVQKIDHNETVRHAYTTMLDELTQPQLGARALTSALMKACMVLVLRQFIKSEAPHSALLVSLADARLRKAIDVVINRPADRHTNKSLSVYAGMSSSAFYRHFDAVFSMTPMQFVAKTRLQNAAQLLRSTPLPVKLIAGLVGFASRSHFSRDFKASYGISPAEFRTGLKAGPIVHR